MFLLVCVFSFTANVQAINPDLDIGIESISFDCDAIEAIDIMDVNCLNDAEVEISPGDFVSIVTTDDLLVDMDIATPYNWKGTVIIYSNLKVDNPILLNGYLYTAYLCDLNLESFSTNKDPYVLLITTSNGGIGFRC